MISNTKNMPPVTGTGKSGDDPIIINAPDSMQGVAAEYAWLEAKYGKFPRSISTSQTDANIKGWRIVNRELSADYTSCGGRVYSHPGRTFEVFELRHETGESEFVYFDITSFFGYEVPHSSFTNLIEQSRKAEAKKRDSLISQGIIFAALIIIIAYAIYTSM